MIETGLRRAEDPCALARLMFERVLTGWAMDVLSLRRRGLDRPGHREPRGIAVAPAPDFEPAAGCDDEAEAPASRSATPY